MDIQDAEGKLNMTEMTRFIAKDKKNILTEIKRRRTRTRTRTRRRCRTRRDCVSHLIYETKERTV